MCIRDRLAAVALGGAGMTLVCFAAAWPLGLGEELRDVAAGERRHKSAGHGEKNRV